MLEPRPWLDAAARVGSTVTLYHGTNPQAWEIACHNGQLAARTDWAGFVGAVEAEFGLRPKAVWLHPVSSFTRTARQGDGHVYCTADKAIAASYAAQGSEAIADTLRAVYSVLHPHTSPFVASAKPALDRFVADWMERHHMAPLVLTLAVPLAELPIPASSLIKDPAEWWAAANHFGPRPAVVFDGSIPLNWVTDPTPPAPSLGI